MLDPFAEVGPRSSLAAGSGLGRIWYVRVSTFGLSEIPDVLYCTDTTGSLAYSNAAVSSGCRATLRRMEDKIRSLCEQILAESGDPIPRIVELRDALHRYVQRLRDKLARYPVTEERRIAFMDPINCVVCSQPLTLLTTDTCSDDNGKPVHRQCYAKRAA